MIKQTSPWTPEEDALIANLYEHHLIQDWAQIADIIHRQYHFPVRAPKLYKERYTNHINPAVFKIDWSHQEELLFIKLHNEIGNKWAAIAQHLPGKTDNCVKNHFYSKLRKLLRKLNKIIQFFLKKQFRPIDIAILYKIVQAAEERFKDKPNCDSNVSMQCLKKNDAQDEEEVKYTQENIEEYRELIKEIYRVSKLYKRKSKKVRNSLIQAPVNSSRKKAKKQQVKVENSQESEFSASKSKQSKQKLPNTILVKKQLSESKSENFSVKEQQAKQEQFEKPYEYKKIATQTNAKIQVQEGEGIQQLLRTAGILHDQVQQKGTKNEKRQRKYSNSQLSTSSVHQNNSNQVQQINLINSSNFEYSPLQSFTSQQMQNFLGFPMVNNNAYANFTLSEKSSFKSYSERDPSQIDNPFFDEYSSSNGRLMFPMNFNVSIPHQYPSPLYNTENLSGYPGYDYGNGFYEQKGHEDVSKGRKPNH